MDQPLRTDAPTAASRRDRVAALLDPRNVVIAGATDRPGNWAQRVWRNLGRYGFPGPVYPLNPSRDSVWDTRCYPDFASLPEPPDHVVVVVPARFVPDSLREAARFGARSANVLTAGFDESSDPAGKAAGAALRAVIAETGIGVCGPNCLGNMNGFARFMTITDDRAQNVGPGPVAVIGQSGGIAMALKRTLEERGNDTGFLVTSGNEAGLGTADYIDYFATLPGVRVIVCYLESVRDPQAFLAACRTARAAGKPVVVAKLGSSDAGRAAALAHTGALAGSMEVFDAVAGEAGAIRAGTLDDVVEVVEYLLHAPLPKGPRIGGFTLSGGLRGLMLDAAASHGLRFPPLAPATRKRLAEFLGVGTIIGNPLDAGFAALTSQDAYLNSIRALLADPGIDLLLLQEELPRVPGTERKAANLRAVEAIAAHAKKPIAFVTMISHGLNDQARALRAELPHLTFMQEPDKTLHALARVVAYSAGLARRPARVPAAPKGARQRLDRCLARHAGAETVTLGEVESKALLRAYGLRVPKERVAVSAEEAVRVARRIGFPVVLKAASAALAHKSEAGAVLVGIASADAVRRGFRRIVRNVKRHAPEIALDGVLVAEEVQGGVELVLGASWDAEMGPVVMVGSGGVALELHRDVAFAAPPLDRRRATALIDRTRAARLIDGWRGAPAVDRAAAVDALVALSRLAVDLGPRLQAIDVNPFVLRRRGGIALDGLIVLAGNGG
jgi:acetyltransferase